MSDEPTAPFTFRPAPAKPPRQKTSVDAAATTVVGNDPFHPGKKTRHRVAKEQSTEPKKTRKRRARLADDVAVLKACLRQLRTLDPKDALRTVETLRVLFK